LKFLTRTERFRSRFNIFFVSAKLVMIPSHMNNIPDRHTAEFFPFHGFVGPVSAGINPAGIFPIRAFFKVPARIFISAATGAAAQTLAFPLPFFFG